MTSYTIQTGDNLWNIAKKQYNLSTNNDIQKAVNLIVQNNNISNPNLIFAQSKIELPELQNETKTAELKNETDENIFEEFSKWQDNHADLMLEFDSYEDYLNSTEASDLGLDFDFMDGKDFNNEEEYNSQLLKLAQGEIKQKDKNDDNKISLNEYLEDEFKTGALEYQELIKDGIMTEETAVDIYSNVLAEAITVFSIIDSEIGDNDNYINDKEFATYYSYMDKYSNKNKDTDGKLNIEAITNYPEFLANQVTIPDSTKEKAKNIAKKLLKTNEAN